MAAHIRSLIGRRFGRLKVMHYAGPDKHRKSTWCCVCDCGNVVRVPGHRLLGEFSGAGLVRSCGCLRADPQVRRKARLKVGPRKRRRIALQAAAAVRKRSMPYAMSATIAAEQLGISLDQLRALVAAGEISGKIRDRNLYVSSQQVCQLIGSQERQKRVCKRYDDWRFGGAN